MTVESGNCDVCAREVSPDDAPMTAVLMSRRPLGAGFDAFSADDCCCPETVLSELIFVVDAKMIGTG